MDHDYIAEHGLVSLYVSGKLSPGESKNFEEHFIHCKQCLEELELTRDLRDGLKQVAREDAVRPGMGRLATVPQLASTPWAGRVAVWQRPRILAYATLVLAIALGAVFFTQARHRNPELAEVRRDSENWQRRYTEERHAREALQQQIDRAAPRGQDQSKDQNTLAATLQPAPLFFLNVTRGSDQDGSAPANRVAVPSTSGSIALSLEFEKDSAFRSYRAQLKDSRGRALWSADNIPSPPSGAIAITLPSSLLSKGNYTVTLDGLTSAGRYLAVAHFSFQATPQK